MTATNSSNPTTTSAGEKMYDALMVITKTPYIYEYLQAEDPKALKQCLDALQTYLHQPHNRFIPNGAVEYTD
jgi:hypothetical protein